MPNLFPVFNTPPVIEDVQRKQGNTFKPSVFFDFKTGDFKSSPNNNLVTADGYDSWRQWCIKTVHTERYAHLGYSGRIGVELENLIGRTDKAVAESKIRKTIEEAILSDPMKRAKVVSDFKFRWGSDYVNVELSVTSVRGDKADLEVSIGKGGAYHGG